MRYVAYSDESYITDSRYRSMATFTFPERHEGTIGDEIAATLDSSSVEEFKWKRLDSAKYRHCALKLFDVLFDAVIRLGARMDTVIWDTHDQRHAVQNRDDGGNYERMFFQLHRQTFLKREKGATWRVHPDERMGVDWKTVHVCLEAIGRRREYVPPNLFDGFFHDQNYQVREFEEVRSHEAQCCQLSDLIAGMAVFSRQKHPLFWEWHAQKEPSLFPLKKLSLSGSDKERFPVLDDFNARCKAHKLGVSLRGRGGLYTYEPKNPLNFWLYAPQHDADRAPVKEARP